MKRALPDGDAYYTFLLRQHTTTEMTADAIHDLGLAQVERVQAEMRAFFDQLGYPTDDDLGSLRARADARADSSTVTHRSGKRSCWRCTTS